MMVAAPCSDSEGLDGRSHLRNDRPRGIRSVSPDSVDKCALIISAVSLTDLPLPSLLHPCCRFRLLVPEDVPMLVVMKAHATPEEISAVCSKIESLGYRAHSIPGAERTAVGITGNKGEVEPGAIDEMPGVQEVIQVTKPYKLVSRDMKAENTVVTFSGTDATFGGPGLAIIAGPCAI